MLNDINQNKTANQVNPIATTSAKDSAKDSSINRMKYMNLMESNYVLKIRLIVKCCTSKNEMT